MLAGPMRIWPNPASRVIYLDQAPSAPVQLMNLNGQSLKIWSAEEAADGMVVEDLPAGVYVLRVGEQKGRVVRIQ
jgi:hypothetical protein